MKLINATSISSPRNYWLTTDNKELWVFNRSTKYRWMFLNYAFLTEEELKRPVILEIHG